MAPIDCKKEEFRKYLERAGVMDAFTKVLVSLYEETEKPDDALEYIRKNLGGVTDASKEIEALKKELDASKKELDDAIAKITELKSKLVKYEPDESTA